MDSGREKLAATDPPVAGTASEAYSPWAEDPDNDLEWEKQESIRREKVVNGLDFDPEQFELEDILKAFVELCNNQGITNRSLGVTMNNATLYGVDERFAVLPTVGDILQLPVTIFRAIKAGKTPTRKILHSVNAVAKPGEMVLILGRPGAGCTSFLKTVAGTDLSLYKKLEGNIRYDGIPQTEMIKRFKNDLIYNPELDVHFPHLTVEQTLRFAVACKTPRLRINHVSREVYIDKMVQVLATVLGLRHALHTMVGNDFVRGVSGGERKRVSIGEALACRGTVYCWDNATRGLDASTALEFAQTIRKCTQVLRTTAFVTAYQAGESLYEQFDRVSVLYHGHQVYYGPANAAKAYFERMGYQCPARQTTAEFLTAITDPIGRYKFPNHQGFIPETADEMEKYWKNSPEYAQLMSELDHVESSVDPETTRQVVRSSLLQEKMRFHRKTSRYTTNFPTQVKLCTIRAFQRLWGAKQYAITLIVAGIVQGLVSGSLYYNLSDSVTGAFSRGGVLFFAALYVSLMGLAEVTASFENRPIIFKHKNYSMYHASTDAIASFIQTLPVSFANASTFVIVLYFLTNMQREAGKFFIALLFVFMLNTTMVSLFRAVASLNKTIAGAQAISGFFIMCTLMYSSYMVQRPSMHPWFKWISYVNPILYAFESMIASEFHGRKMDCIGKFLIPNGPSYTDLGPGEQACAFAGSVEGQTYVLGDDYLRVAFTYSYSHVWRNLGFMFAFISFNLFVNCVAIEIIKPIKGGSDRLIFLRGHADHIFKKVASDEESTLDAIDSTIDDDHRPKSPSQVFEDLRSKDLFAWKNVDYVIPYDGGKRQLLDNVFGFCKPGTLTALMGESGAGKTTLLNTLAQRNDMGTVTGDMLVNGKPLDASFSRRTGYVLQQDIHVAEATVRESLYFAARLRRPASVPDQEKVEYCEKIIEVLAMDTYADAIVGESGSGLNVEQRKKLSIAVELVAKPSLLLFLDEPTSGLDSQSAWAIVSLLRELAQAGQSILCTIHQPSATLFEAFDRLLLLKKGGQMVYLGDIGENSRIMLDYFESHGARVCRPEENPAEYMLEVIGAGATATTDQDWFEVWENSRERAVAAQDLETIVEEYQNQPPLPADKFKELKQTYAVNPAKQFIIVMRRTALSFWRDPEYIMSKMFIMISGGLFIGFTYWDLPYTQTGAQNGMFAAFLAVVLTAPTINMIQQKAINGRELYETREQKARTYHWANMIWAQAIVELPYLWVGGFLMFVGLYFPTKASTVASQAGVYYMTQAVFLPTFAVSFALMILYFSPNLEVAGVLVGFLYSFIVAFAGVVQPKDLMPGFWLFMYRVSPYTYYIGNLVSALLHKRPIRCAMKEMAQFSPPPDQTCGEFMKDYIADYGGYIDDPGSTDLCHYCSYSNADQYLAGIGVSYGYIWRNVGFFFIYFFFNMFLAMVLYWIFRFHKWRKG
ncbi:protein Snq2p [Diutina catenulata]